MTRVKQCPPVDGGWGWVVVLATAVGGFCMIGTAKSFGLIADELKAYFDAPQYQVALVFGVSAVIYTFAAPISLILGERFTQRKIVMIGGLVGCIGMSLSCLCFNLVYIICTFGICFGIGNGFFYGNMLVMVGKYFVKRRSFANGLALAGSSIGQFALPPLIQYFINTYTIKGALLLLGGIYFHISACGAVSRPLSYYGRKPEPRDEDVANDKIFCSGSNMQDLTLTVPSSDTEKGDNLADSENGDGKEACEVDVNSEQMNHQTSSLLDLPNGGIHQDTESSTSCCKSSCCKSSCCKPSCTIPRFLDFSILKNRVCLLYSFVMFFMFFGFFNFILFLPTIAASRGVLEYKKAYLVSIAGVSDLVARVSVGFLSDLNLIPRYKIMSICSLVIGADILIFMWAQAYWQMALQSGIYGFFGGGYIMLFSLVLIDFVGLELLPRSLGPVLFLQGTGGAIGQVFLGWIRDMTGNFVTVLLICGICNLIGGLSILLYPLAKKWEHKRVSKKSSNPAHSNEKSV